MSLFFAPSAGEVIAWSPLRRTLWMSLGLVYLLVEPIQKITGDHPSTARLIVLVVSLLSFAGVFLALPASHIPWHGRTSRRAYLLLGALTAMAIGYPLGVGDVWLGMPIYLGVAYAMVLPIRWAPRGVLAATVITFVLSMTLGLDNGSLALLTFEALTLGMMMVAFRGSRALVHQLREARSEVARLAAGEERLRIARDLHDLLGHSLSLIVLKSEVAGRLIERDPARGAREIGDIEAVARRSLADVRETVSGYRRRSLTDELDSARAVLDAAGVDATITTSGTPLPDPLDGLFGWAVREGVTNVVRHARARECVITIVRDDSEASVEIADDGIGTASYGSDGNGLAGLAERVERTGGAIEAGPRPGGGFRLAMQVPSGSTAAPDAVGGESAMASDSRLRT